MPDASPAILLVLAVYALTSLLRIVLRVRSGGAYGPFLLPTSIIVLTYVSTCVYLDLFRNKQVRRIAQTIVYSTLFLSILTIIPIAVVRYRIENVYKLQTPRGIMFTEPGRGQAFADAIQFIEHETVPGAPIAVLPEGSSLTFFTNRCNPLREEIIIPGFLNREGEKRLIECFKHSTRFVFIANRPNREFGVYRAGPSDGLMSWIEQNFEPVATFGANHDSSLQYGARPFFIRAYRKTH